MPEPRLAQACLEALRSMPLTRRTGRVVRVSGKCIESRGPDAAIGELCDIHVDATGPAAHGLIKAEVVGVQPGRLVLMPYGDVKGIASGCLVVAAGRRHDIPVGEEFLGRVIDAFGKPLDDGPAIDGDATARQALQGTAPNPLARPRIDRLLETGVRAIDGLLPLGLGQRSGIFAGSGVGKSTLLGMLARQVKTDVNVIALIGERGREVREFIEKQLGAEGMRRSIVIVATSDQPALAIVRAAHAATAHAEHLRQQGRHVLLMMDSLTRFAMARREIGLAAGEPPTARGYTPSVFADIPELCERCGTSESGGSITALYTVLVEGDDFNEPISDIVRATLDGHIMLSRELAHAGHYPAIDVLQSVSRLAADLTTDSERQIMRAVTELLATHARHRPMIEMGAYRQGSRADIDHAIARQPVLTAVLRQEVNDASPRADTLARLKHASGGAP
ncbi:FliI/YscN family ATPase [Noviherbaspirillum sp. 17J57-3]|uniref:FliI/YscN family ATPase n=2 Tax=Noviherbaspirillum galbum TaxID=2709383 RepID=A0A6B3SR77_9BURK|nr:FliI/YscN family ATPase [Noviherbaspirillum galbum]